MRSFFTIPDINLTQESSVDPMGLQVIWTNLGQAIFEEKITTIANDLRVFTFNMFHHHILNTLFTEHSKNIQLAMERYKEWRTEMDVKSGLLMFIEDIVTHVFYKVDTGASEGIEKLGILGLTKANREYALKNEDQMILAGYKKSGLLKNQLNLGMTGRYKGPMMNLGFFDRSFRYLPGAWDNINKFYLEWTDAVELERVMVRLINGILLESTFKEYPRVMLSDVKNKQKLWKSIVEGYIKCFGSRAQPIIIKQFWQDKLGLNKGAAKALYEVTGNNIKSGIDHYRYFSEAKDLLRSEPNEFKKIQNILEIEPFLSHSEYILRFLSQHGIKNIQDERESIDLLRQIIIQSANFEIPESAPKRLTELRNVMINGGPVEEWLSNIVIYHNRIMEKRGGHPWLEVNSNGAVRHYFGPELPQILRTISGYLKEKPWWHTYYLETLRNIYIGIN